MPHPHKPDTSFIAEDKIRSILTIPENGILKSSQLLTWGEFAEATNQGRVKFHEIAEDRMVWVLKADLPNGVEVKGQHMKNASLIAIFDAETGELLSMGVIGD